MQDKTTSFGQLNEREREILERLSRGLSDQRIADDLFLSLHTVKWYNRQIYGKLGVGSRTQAIARIKSFGLPESAAPVASQATPRHNLPAETAPFIGREREVAELMELLRAHRLVTLTGPGGIGKTRLALRLAEEAAGEFADGVYFVDLAPLTDHSLVARPVARALGVQDNPTEPLADTLARVLAERRTLLLLIDNFEHVIAAAPLVTRLLSASPRLRVLATSREPLRLAGEQEFPVPPLSLPDEGMASVRDVVQSEAGALFAQRARLADPRFTLNHDNAPAVAAICTRLEGLPLALELAAARCKLLPPQRLLERLQRAGGRSALHTLATGSRDAPLRQRTIRDSIEWSYNLLMADEKKLFERLSVFRGGRSLEAIEAVCAEGLAGDVFEVLASLVDKSLVQQKEAPGGEPRFVMAELIHQFAGERLEATGEAEAMRRRHATYFVELAEQAEPELRLAGYRYWSDRFELETDNIRAVLEWTLGPGDVTLGVRMAGALGLFWYGKGHHLEGIRWTEALLPRLEEAPAAYQPRFLISAGHMAWMRDPDRARQLHGRALEIAQEQGDAVQAAWAPTFLAIAMLGEPERAMPLAEEGLARFRALGFKPGIAQALNIVGEIARLHGDDNRARLAYEECLAIVEETGEERRIRYMYNNLAYIAQHEGDHERALTLARRCLLLARESGDRHDTVQSFVALVGPLAALGQRQRAARLLGTREALLERLGAFGQPSDLPEYERTIATLRAQLGEAAFQAAWEEGRQMSLEQAIAEMEGDGS